MGHEGKKVNEGKKVIGELPKTQAEIVHLHTSTPPNSTTHLQTLQVTSQPSHSHDTSKDKSYYHPLFTTPNLLFLSTLHNPTI